MLNTPIGQTLVYVIHRKHDVIGLPEVVERELKQRLVERGVEIANSVDTQSQWMCTLVDSFIPTAPPSESQIRDAVTNRLKKLSGIVRRVPFTLEHANTALNMVMAKLPPNREKDQQFKDSALWQAILALSQEYIVFFVTDDRAFLLDKADPKKGLANNLCDDCRRLGTTVEIFCDLAECLCAIEGDAPAIDDETAIWEQIMPEAWWRLGLKL